MRQRTLLGGVALAVILLVVAFSGPAAAHGGDDGTHHHDGAMGTHDGMGWGWGMGAGLWGLWPLLVLVIGGAGVYLLVTGAGGMGNGDDALDVLRERYARGEIDEEEFERRRQQLDNW